MLIPEHWPKWLVIPIGVLMIAFTIGVGLALEEVTQPLAPVLEPTPTLVMLPYAAPVSGGCVNCHTSREKLAEEALAEPDIDRLYINPEDVQSLHGRLGCVTCHRGNGQAEDLKASHVGLVVNPTTVDNAKVYCLTCHHRLRTDVPEHFIHTPHREVLMANHDDTVWSCSNCHLAVAHGARPADTHERQRELCVDCHQQQNLPPERLACSGCHSSPHDIVLDCDNCHVSTRLWSQYQASFHPMPLNGRHGEIHCFECHTKPNFRTINNFTCANCHTRPHEYGGDSCTQCHHDDQPWNQIKELRYVPGFKHPEPWQRYMDIHAKVSCLGCHFQGYEGLSTDCASCHKTALPKSET